MSKALLLRSKIPMREVLNLIETHLRPHDMNVMKITAQVHYKFVLRQLQVPIQILTESWTPWSPMATWNWSDSKCIAFYRTSVLQAAVR